MSNPNEITLSKGTISRLMYVMWIRGLRSERMNRPTLHDSLPHSFKEDLENEMKDGLTKDTWGEYMQTAIEYFEQDIADTEARIQSWKSRGTTNN